MSLYEIAVPKFSRSLKAMRKVLEKGQAHAIDHKIDPAVLINARLFPDMFPFKRQIQIATDSARRGCGRLANKDVPEIPDTEESFDELIARVDVAIEYIESLQPQDFIGAEDKQIELPLSTGSITLNGTDFLMGFALANFSFHFVTAYNILRHNGVPLGKMDYLGG